MANIDHVSFSAIKDYSECPHRFKLLKIDKIKNKGNIYTAFGSAVHKAIESNSSEKTDEELYQIFNETFDKELKNIDYDSKFERELREQARTLLPEVFPALHETFGDFEIIGSELEFLEEIENNFKFKGFIDFFIKLSNNTYVVADFKTATYWDAKKRSDKMVNYQLVWYKHFMAKKFNIDPKLIETYFVLLKRTSKVGQKIEIFRITSGNIKTKNSIEFLNKTVKNILNETFIKNRLSCKYCPFVNSEHCK